MWSNGIRKKKFTSTIESISNLNIRVADIVMIPRVKSTYFLLIFNFKVGLIGTMARSGNILVCRFIIGVDLDIYVSGQKNGIMRHEEDDYVITGKTPPNQNSF